MSEITGEHILEALKQVRYPGYSRDIVSFGIVRGAKFHEGIASVRLELTTDKPEILDAIKAEAEKVLAAIPGINRVLIETRANPPAARPGAPAGAAEKNLLPGVKHIVAVASGKGGVGKSTVAVNLAVSLAGLGWRTGLLDADIYGPSVPLMMGADGPPEQEGQKAIPFLRHGVKIMSIGFFLEKDAALVWRGPMVMKALTQLMGDVVWGDLDYLVVDLPPGTGDAQLTLSQAIKLDGAVIVTTPQDVSLIDAVKGVTMFRKVDVPILGIVENMSYFTCGKCGERTEIFSHGGARREADRLGVPLLGEVPIDPKIRAGADAGVPIVAGEPDSPQSAEFRRIAAAIAREIDGSEAPAATSSSGSPSAFDRIRKVFGA
jgi:ATP-binding protein involved in chromosome partitioning